MTVVTRSPGAVGSGPWTNFTVEGLAVGGVSNAYVVPDTTEGFVQSASSFGFAIPADATITSLTVEGAYKIQGGAGLIGLSPSVGVAVWGSETEQTEWTVIQGVTDTALPTVAQLNSSNFAVVANASRPSGAATWVYLDYITLTVEYDEYVPGVPTVVTTAPWAITQYSATGGGNVTSDGGSAITDRGIFVGLSPHPVGGAIHVDAASGPYLSYLTGLTPNTIYYVAAFAGNSAGYGYGDDETFVTLPGIPSVATWAVWDIAATTATGGGSVTSDGGADVDWRGVVWSTSPNPRGGGQGDSDGMGDFGWTMTGLAPATRYYVAAFAHNSAGYAFGADVTFVTLPSGPAVATASIFDITATTATGGGSVNSDGGDPVLIRGLCVGTSPAPRTAYGPRMGTGMGMFYGGLTGLTPATRYYVAAYAGNNYGTAYGADVTFVTDGPPTVETAGVYDITATTTVSGGNVISDNGEAVSARGVCWSVAENPTTAGSHTADGSGLGVFVSHLTGLTEGITYNVRAYAVNAVGTAYGTVVVFTAIADAPPVEPPPQSPRDPSQNLLFDGTLEIMVGTLDVAGSATQMKYSNANPGGFGNLSFRLPADAPYAAFDAQVVKGAAVTMKHGLVGFAATLFEGEVTSDVSHATISGGKAYYDVTCAGLWWAAGQRKDFSMVVGDDAYDQWFTMDDNAKAFQVSTDGKLEIRLEAGQSAAAGDSANLYYWLGKGLGDPEASIDFLFGMLSLGVTGGWDARVSAAPTPWGPWTECAGWLGQSAAGVAQCFPTVGSGPQALRLQLRSTIAVSALAADNFIRLDKVSVSSGVSANGLSAVSAANPTVVTANGAHELKTGDRVFITQAAASVPTISGWRTVTVTDGAHFTVPVAVTTAGGAGTFYKATRVDQALVEIAVTTGLATLASLQPGGIGNLNWGLNVRPHASRAGGIDLLAATNVAPFDYGFWDNKTFYCQDRPETIRALRDYLIDSSLPGIDFDVRRATEDSPTTVKVLYKFRAEEGETSPYPDGTALAVYRTAAGYGGPAASANLIPAMTSNTAPSGTASASSILATLYDAWKAFDRWNSQADGLCWATNSVSSGWLTYELPESHVVTRYTLTTRNPPDANVCPPKTWTFEGYNGATWDVLDTQANVTDWANTKNIKKTFDIANSTAYTKYRLNVSAGNDAGIILLGELEMMETVYTATPAWADASPVLDVWNEWADLSLTTAQAGDLGDQILAWLSANAYQGGGTIAPATVPLRAVGTKPTAYIRGGDYIEDSNLDTGPLMITGFSMDADRGVATIGIGENRRAFVERLTPDKA